MGKPKRKHTAEYKAWVVQRLAKQEQSVTALSQELGISRGQIYRWQESYLRSGAAGLERRAGRPRLGLERPGRPLSPSEEISALRQKVGEQQLVIDFFRVACKRVEEPRRRSTAPGATASTEPSGK